MVFARELYPLLKTIFTSVVISSLFYSILSFPSFVPFLPPPFSTFAFYDSMSEIKTPDEKEKQANLGAACFRCRGFR